MTDNTKKTLTVVGVLILLAVASLYLIVRIGSAKITTFEECEKARWLVRSITVYDGYGPIEAECVLKSGKSFVKKRDSSSFGNDQVEKAITDYLLTQKYFSWKTTTDSRNFCVIENLNPEKDLLFPLYVWVRCGEFILQNGKLKELSGLSIPAKIEYPNELSFYDISKMSHEAPRNGSFYLKEIKTIFPLNVQEVIFGFDITNLNKKIETTAFSGFENTYNPVVPVAFNLIFRYGVGGKNELDTFKQTYTKDMVMDPPVTIKFKLLDNELAGIYQQINERKLFDMTDESNDEQMSVTPCSSYYLKVQMDSVQKELSWDDCRGKVSDRLKQFTGYIISIIESKEEYKKLPAPRGGYL